MKMNKSYKYRMYLSGKYYVSVLVEYESQVLERTLDKFIGLDYSMYDYI